RDLSRIRLPCCALSHPLPLTTRLPRFFCFLPPSSFSFFFSCSGAHRDLHSFPTRRSSDLAWSAGEPSARFPSRPRCRPACAARSDRKSTRLNSSHVSISYAVFCLKKKKEYRIVLLYTTKQK